MFARIIFGSFIVLLVVAQAGFAGTKNHLQNYFNDVAVAAKAAENPMEKRDILNRKLQNMSDASDKILAMPFLLKTDREGMLRFKSVLQARHDELAGLNGYAKVPDEKLNSFADYIVQDMEQADTYVTISLVTLLIIIILVILIAR